MKLTEQTQKPYVENHQPKFNEWKKLENWNQRSWWSNDNQTTEETKLHIERKEKKTEGGREGGREGERERETNLAAQRTEPERVKEASATNLTGVGDTLSRPGLWALIQKYNLRTVDNVGLNARYVDVLLNFINPHHVVVRGSSYLQQPPPPPTPSNSQGNPPPPLILWNNQQHWKMWMLNPPEQRSDPCDGSNSRNRGHLPYNPNKTYCIRSY